MAGQLQGCDDRQADRGQPPTSYTVHPAAKPTYTKPAHSYSRTVPAINVGNSSCATHNCIIAQTQTAGGTIQVARITHSRVTQVNNMQRTPPFPNPSPAAVSAAAAPAPASHPTSCGALASYGSAQLGRGHARHPSPHGCGICSSIRIRISSSIIGAAARAPLASVA